MRRSIEFQQQYYADDHGMWMETQAQQNGYAFQQESWSSGSGNNFHNRFPAMNTNKLNAFALDSDLSMSKQHSNKLRAMHMNMLDEFAVESNLFMSKQHDMLGSMHMKWLGAYGMDSELSRSKQHDKLLGSMHVNMIGAYGLDSEFSKSKQHGMLGKGHGMFQEGMQSEHGFGYGQGGGRKFNNSGGQRECFSEETEYMAVYAEGHVGGGSYHVNPYGRNMIRNINGWTSKGL